MVCETRVSSVIRSMLRIKWPVPACSSKQVFEQAGEGVQQGAGLLLSLGACAVGLGYPEESSIVRIPCAIAGRVGQHHQSVLAARQITFQIEAECLTDGAFRQARDQCALFRFPILALLGKHRFDLFRRQCAQAKDAGAGTNGGQKFARIFCQQKNVSVGRVAPRES